MPVADPEEFKSRVLENAADAINNTNGVFKNNDATYTYDFENGVVLVTDNVTGEALATIKDGQLIE